MNNLDAGLEMDWIMLQTVDVKLLELFSTQIYKKMRAVMQIKKTLTGRARVFPVK
jgi:hypothetical protein